MNDSVIHLPSEVHVFANDYDLERGEFDIN